MSDENTNNDAFHDLRKTFDGLQVDEQARFLVEAAMSLVTNGAREAGNVVQTVVDDIVENIKKERDACASEEEAPKEEAKPKAKAKPAAKKTTTRKRAPRKPAADSGDAS